MTRLRHFIDTQDYNKEELLAIIELARQLKEADRAGACPKLLDGVSLGMLCEEPATHACNPFEVAMQKLGGHAHYLGRRDPLDDPADVIEARAPRHETVLELARKAKVPVINGATDYNHPTQALCDLMTMMEYTPGGKLLEEFRVTFIGDATRACNSLVAICTRMGMHFVHAAPGACQIGKRIRAIGSENCRGSGGTLEVTEDLVAAVRNADFIYIDPGWHAGQEQGIAQRRAACTPACQIDEPLLQRAPSHCLVLCCPPALRGVETTDAILDSPQSIFSTQMENRLHIEKSLLVWFVMPRLKKPTAELKAYYAGRIENYLERKAALMGGS